ncbi:MAG: BrnT family toxin [Chloroflexota bacterium]|nr:MAG: BrnT family toxin [Chloroflexota bacterium]
MKTATFQWDEENVEHIASHRVEPFEAEEVLDDDPLILKTRDDKYLAYGQTDAGRYLLVVFVWKYHHTIRVITARDLTRAEKRRLKRRKM